MKEFKIEVPNGYEIDKEKSTFEKIVFKEIERAKYPITIQGICYYYGIYRDTFSLRYEDRLRVLDRLLLARDKWNEIDGFVPDWEYGSQFKYSIFSNRNELLVYTTFNTSCSFSFKTQETAQLFLDTFRKELEEIKELL